MTNILSLLAVIAVVESGGDTNAIGRCGEVGIYQIAISVLTDYNHATGAGCKLEHLHNPDVSYDVASWQLQRLAVSLDRHAIPVTAESLCKAWRLGLHGYLRGDDGEAYWRKCKKEINKQKESK